MSDDAGVSMMALGPISQSIARLGGSAAEFLSALGVDAGSASDTFVSGEAVGRALDGVARKLGLQNIGLSLARASPVGSLGLIDYGLMSCPNLRGAFERASIIQALTSQRYTVLLEENGDVTRYRYRYREGVTPVPALVELYLATLVLRAGEAMGRPLPLRAVRFSHRVENPSQHYLLFGTKVWFEQPSDEIEFATPQLDVPFRTADAMSLKALEAAAIPMAEKESLDPFASRVRSAIARLLPTKEFAIADLAKDLDISVRSLQRQLEGRTLSYRDLLDQTRRDTAMDLLGREGITAVDAAERLGFSDPASFSRAFVRWTGTTPGSFRTTKRG